MKSKGILLLYSESDQLDYLKLAELCARLAKHYTDLPVTIKQLNSKQKNIRTFRWQDDMLETVEWNNYNRCDAYSLSPYDQTLLIDVDYMIQNDTLAQYFHSDHDYICHNNSWDISGNDVFRHDEYMSQNKFDMRWATVVYFTKCEQNERIFETWRSVQNNYEYYSKLFGFNKAPYRNDFAMSISHQINSGYANTGTFNYSMPALSSTDEVIDYNDGRWLVKYRYKESHNVMRYTGDLHVMNKRSLLDTQVYDKLWNSHAS